MTSARPRVVTSRATGPDLSDLSGPFLLALLGGDEAAVEDDDGEFERVDGSPT